MIMKIPLMTQYILRQVRLEISQHHSTLVLLEDTKLEKKEIWQTHKNNDLFLEGIEVTVFIHSEALFEPSQDSDFILAKINSNTD